MRPHGAYFVVSAAAHAAVFAGLAAPGGEPPTAPAPLQVRLALPPRTSSAVTQVPAAAAKPPTATAAVANRNAPRLSALRPVPAHNPSPPPPPLPASVAQDAMAPPSPAAEPAPPLAATPPREQITLARAQVPVAVTETTSYPDPELVAGYARNLSASVARLKRYPALARMRGWEGTTLVSVSIGSRGELLDLKVSRSSGFEVLDEQALEMIRAAQPLPPSPPSLRGLALVVQLPVAFSLTP